MLPMSPNNNSPPGPTPTPRFQQQHQHQHEPRPGLQHGPPPLPPPPQSNGHGPPPPEMMMGPEYHPSYGHGHGPNQNGMGLPPPPMGHGHGPEGFPPDGFVQRRGDMAPSYYPPHGDPHRFRRYSYPPHAHPHPHPRARFPRGPWHPMNSHPPHPYYRPEPEYDGFHGHHPYHHPPHAYYGGPHHSGPRGGPMSPPGFHYGPQEPYRQNFRPIDPHQQRLPHPRQGIPPGSKSLSAVPFHERVGVVELQVQRSASFPPTGETFDEYVPEPVTLVRRTRLASLEEEESFSGTSEHSTTTSTSLSLSLESLRDFQEGSFSDSGIGLNVQEGPKNSNVLTAYIAAVTKYVKIGKQKSEFRAGFGLWISDEMSELNFGEVVPSHRPQCLKAAMIYAGAQSVKTLKDKGFYQISICMESDYLVKNIEDWIKKTKNRDEEDYPIEATNWDELKYGEEIVELCKSFRGMRVNWVHLTSKSEGYDQAKKLALSSLPADFVCPVTVDELNSKLDLSTTITM